MKLRIRYEEGSKLYWLEKKQFLFNWWPITCSYNKDTIYKAAKDVAINKNESVVLQEWKV